MNKPNNVEDICDWIDRKYKKDSLLVEEEERPNLEAISKLSSIAIELYLKSPKMFIAEFNRVIRKVKLNIKIKETYKTRDARGRVYAAISFFDKMSEKQSYNEAYEIASKHYQVPEKYLRSIIGTRNNLRKNALKDK